VNQWYILALLSIPLKVQHTWIPMQVQCQNADNLQTTSNSSMVLSAGDFNMVQAVLNAGTPFRVPGLKRSRLRSIN
jgi:hypothetical protein